MTPGAYAAYSHVVTTTTSKDRILILLYEGAVRFVQLAREGIRASRVAAKGENISKALAIVHELDHALDHQIGGELAANLSSLYRYMARRLLDANILDEEGALDEVERLLSVLKEAFEEAAHLARGTADPRTAAPEPREVGRISFAV